MIKLQLRIKIALSLLWITRRLKFVRQLKQVICVFFKTKLAITVHGLLKMIPTWYLLRLPHALQIIYADAASVKSYLLFYTQTVAPIQTGTKSWLIHCLIIRLKTRFLERGDTLMEFDYISASKENRIKPFHLKQRN